MNTKTILAYSPNFDKRSAKTKINSIVIHHTELQSVKAVYDIFEDPERKVSSHYLVGRDGSLHQFVDEKKRAWHAGISTWRGTDKLNDSSIGIELDNNGDEPFSKPLMDTLVILCKELVKKYMIEERNIVGHSDIAYWRKVDPSHYFDWKILAAKNIGFFPKFSAKNSHIYRLNGANLEVVETKKKLAQLGYKVDDFDSKIDHKTFSLLKAFKRRYTPETYAHDYWDTLAEGRLNELLERYGY